MSNYHKRRIHREMELAERLGKERSTEEQTCSIHKKPDVDCPYCHLKIWNLQNENN